MPIVGCRPVTERMDMGDVLWARRGCGLLKNRGSTWGSGSRTANVETTRKRARASRTTGSWLKQDKKHGTQPAWESVAQSRQLYRAACVVCGTIRFRRGNWCNFCHCDTATRDVVIGNVFQDRGQAVHHDEREESGTRQPGGHVLHSMTRTTPPKTVQFPCVSRRFATNMDRELGRSPDWTRLVSSAVPLPLSTDAGEHSKRNGLQPGTEGEAAALGGGRHARALHQRHTKHSSLPAVVTGQRTQTACALVAQGSLSRAIKLVGGPASDLAPFEVWGWARMGWRSTC